MPKKEKKWTGKSIECLFRTQEGFEKTIDLAEFRYTFTFPIYEQVKTIEFTTPEQVVNEIAPGKEKTFYFEKWLNETKTKALYLER